MFRKFKWKIFKKEKSQSENTSKTSSPRVSTSTSTTPPRHSRRSSDLKYLLPKKHEKYQRSEFYKDITSRRKPKPNFVVDHTRIVYKVYYPEKTPRDYHEAVDFYYRSAGLPVPIESLSNLRRTLSQRSRTRNRPKLIKSENVKQYSHYPKRCRLCLHLKNDCICKSFENTDASDKITNLSDWKIIVSLSHDAPQHQCDSNRLSWLEELEEKSKINKRVLKETRENLEACCFPFSTLRVFDKIFDNKKNCEEIDFYMKQ